MKALQPTIRHRLVPSLVSICAGIILLMPFHAFLTVWAAAIAGHYTAFRLWKEVLLVCLTVGSGIIVWADRSRLAVSLHRWYRRRLVPTAVLTYLVLLVIAGVAACLMGGVTPKAFAYGLLIDSRFLIFFLVVWLISQYSGWIQVHWRRILLIPVAIVVIFGILQFTVLPADFLGHFGYGPATIPVVQTVDQKASYQRIQSTLRGANPLGTYLIVGIAALGVLVLRYRKQRWLYAAMLALSLVALALTFSRSAWIGAAAALGWLMWEALRVHTGRRILLIAGSAAVLVFAAVGFSLRNNDVFQNTFFHTDEHSLSPTSSNQGHLSATKDGIIEIAHHPLGSGTGTAGPASVYNDHPARIAEDYYIQIGQEAGIIGLVLFVAINLLVACRLWRRRGQLLPDALLASLIGIGLVNLFSHAWTDDTVSYIWWGLAGAALALPVSAPLTSSVVVASENAGKPGKPTQAGHAAR
jgi:hypothetical protein